MMPPSGRTAYDVAGRYDTAYYDDLLDRYRRRNRFARQRIANVTGLLPPLAGRKILDIGCGMGTFTIEAARQGAWAVGADLAPPALIAARRAASDEGVSTAFVRADATALPCRTAAFDVALAADFTEHLDPHTLAQTARETARVLPPGGLLVIYTPSPTHFLERLRAAGVLRQEPSHIGVRTADELIAAFSGHGFTLRRIEFLPSHVPGLQLLERVFGSRCTWLRRRIGLVLERTGA